MGPERGESAWQKPLEKFIARARVWGGIGGGMLNTIRAYRTYIMSVLSFVAQLESPPVGWAQHE